MQFLQVLLGFLPSSSPALIEATSSRVKPISQVSYQPTLRPPSSRLTYPRSTSSSAASSCLSLSSQASSPQITTRRTPRPPPSHPT
ncbi:hypothetical protein FB451DRAFT_1264708 [Mycena latifolia]|nr:hypothetical protein FB451DRAFT_1264708 [Mycena latifolia]